MWAKSAFAPRKHARRELPMPARTAFRCTHTNASFRGAKGDFAAPEDSMSQNRALLFRVYVTNTQRPINIAGKINAAVPIAYTGLPEAA